jgi:hypothetical protein
MTQPLIQWTTVAALVTSLGGAPFIARPTLAACLSAHFVQAATKCCCGDHCRCLNCSSHRQSSEDQQKVPIMPNGARELIKIAAATLHFDYRMTDNGRSFDSAAIVADARSLQTLFAQHACLRV